MPAGAALTASLEAYEPSTAPAAEGSEVELVLRPRAFVSGVVLTAEGAPALGVQVLARGDGRKGATTGAGGEFRIALGAPGPVTLVAHHSLYGAGELSLEAPAADVQLRVSPLGSLRARLVDRAHLPIAGGAATAFREPGGLREALSSDSPSREDGVIALAGLSPGTYRVRFAADGFQSVERPGVAVAETGEVDLGEVELEAGLEIHGVVLQGADPLGGLRFVGAYALLCLWPPPAYFAKPMMIAARSMRALNRPIHLNTLGVIAM